MATKSFLRNIEIKSPTMGRNLTHAIKASETKSGKAVQMSRKCTELKGESVKKFFFGAKK